jgi:ABC-type uncharacterized transport system permease subunit
MERLRMKSMIANAFVPLLSVLLGFFVGAIIMLVSGYNPVTGYIALVNGVIGDRYVFGETIRAMTPLLLSGLSVAFAFRTGLFNIGVEGQLLVGWLASVWIGISIEGLPMFIHVPLAILGAAVAGALWGFIPGFLKAKYKVHEVIVTIMMNYVALHIANALIRTYLLQPGERTANVLGSASLSSNFLQQITDYSRLHYGIIVALIVAFIMWFLLEKTAKGYELRSVGYNHHASQYAGISVSKNIIHSMLIAGAFAGVAGAMEGLGTYGYMNIQGSFTGVGFNGIAVALLGGNTAFGVVVASLLFGGLEVGALSMQSQAGVPTELVGIVIALIIFFVASSYLIKLFFTRTKKEGM